MPAPAPADTPHDARAGVDSRARRELLLLAVALAGGVLLLPWLIWLLGRAVLGPYAEGGAFALFRDYLAGLAAGSPIFWGVALAPYVLAMLGRLLRWALRASR